MGFLGKLFIGVIFFILAMLLAYRPEAFLKLCSLAWDLVCKCADKIIEYLPGIADKTGEIIIKIVDKIADKINSI